MNKNRFVDNGEGLKIISPSKNEDKKIAQDSILRRNNIAFDRKPSNRVYDDKNGYLKVKNCILSRESVDPYYGREIPGWEALGLDADEVYYVYRPGEELEKAVQSIHGNPLLLGHAADSGKIPLKDKRVGSIMNDAAMDGGDLIGSISVTDMEAIKGIDENKWSDLSAGYTYKAVKEDGEWKGISYDIRMSNIHFNHVALVPEGRVPGAMVADENSIGRKGIMGKLREAWEALRNLVEGDPELEKRAEVFREEFADDRAKDRRDELEDEPSKEEMLEDVEAYMYALEDLEDDTDTAEEVKEEVEEEYSDDKRTRARDRRDRARDMRIKGRDRKDAEVDEIEERRDRIMGEDAKRVIVADAKRAIELEYRAKAEAAKECRAIIGDVDIFGVESPEAIYKMALDAKGISTQGIDKAGYKGMVRVISKREDDHIKRDWLTMDAKPRNNAEKKTAEALNRLGV